MADLLRALFSDLDIDDGTGDLSPAAWAELADLAGHVGATGLLALRLKQRGRLESVPTEVRGPLLARYREYGAFALMLEHELRAIADDFARAAIAFAPLKGGVLMLEGIHADLGARYFNDLDILTRRADRGRVDEILRARGFAPARSGDGPKHLPPYRRGNIFLEVHEFAYWEADGTRVDLDRFLTAGSSLAVTIAHLLHHLLLSSVTEPGLALKTLWDFHELAQHPFVPWDEAAALADRAGVGRALDGIRTTLALLARGSPRADMDPATLQLCDVIDEAELHRREIQHLWQTLRQAPLWYAAPHAWTTLVPTRASMETIYGLSPHSPLAMGAYLIRPFHLTATGLRRLARGGPVWFPLLPLSRLRERGQGHRC